MAEHPIRRFVEGWRKPWSKGLGGILSPTITFPNRNWRKMPGGWHKTGSAQDREWGNSTSLWLMGALWEVSIAVLHIDAHGSLSWLMGYSGLDDAYLCLAFINGSHYENLLHL
ncbi:hypothetical protein AYX13_04691 [Cryptococcus neoformans]|nr:hypothetical protein AYX13_04691 [Cryptococcus neoformans var. grubii]